MRIPNHYLPRVVSLLLAFPATGFASTWDYNFSAGGRAVPFGASFNAELGFNQLLWGQKQTKDDVMYGYIRWKALASTAAVWHRLESSITVAPISFLAFDAGANGRLRLSDSQDTIDCTTVTCTGTVTTPFLRARATLGAAGFFAGGSLKVESPRLLGSTTAFVDDIAVIVAAPGGDTLREQALFAGYTWNDRWTTGVAQTKYSMSTSGTSNTLTAFFARWKMTPETRFAAGIGTYQSSTAPLGATGFIGWEYTGAPSLELD